MELYRPLSTEWHDRPVQDRIDRCAALLRAVEVCGAPTERIRRVAEVLFFAVDNMRDLLEKHLRFRITTGCKIDEVCGRASFVSRVDHLQLHEAWEEARKQW